MRLVDLGQYPRPDVLNIRVGLISQLRLDELPNRHLLQPSQVILLIEVMQPLIEAFLDFFLLLKVGVLCFFLHIII